MALLPSSTLARRLAVQSVLFAVGEGAFLTGSAVFFTQVVGLSAAQVGLGLTIAGVVTFFVAVPLGRLADRFGPQRVWALGAVATAALYATWPFVSGFPAYVALVVVLELVDAAASAGRGAYTMSAFTGAERMSSLAFMRSALNVGFTVGALLGGLALASGDLSVVRAVPVVTALVLVVNGVLITRLPVAAAPDAAPSERSTGALRNRAFLAWAAADGVLSTNQVLLNVVIPLWLVQETDAPRVLLAWLFGTNTVLAVLLQVRASRGAETVDGALRAARVSGAFFVLSCFVVLVTDSTVGWVTIVLVWAGHVTVTGAELFQSASHWGLAAELSDPARRGEYQGAARLGGTVGGVWAPAAYTFLALELGTVGWLVIAAVVAAAVAAMHPAARAAERYLTDARESHVVGSPVP